MNKPWENLSGAHTSIVSFSHVFRTQWYLNLSGFEHVCILASRLHCFRSLAIESSAFVEGHDVTVCIVNKESLHFSSEGTDGFYAV